MADYSHRWAATCANGWASSYVNWSKSMRDSANLGVTALQLRKNITNGTSSITTTRTTRTTSATVWNAGRRRLAKTCLKIYSSNLHVLVGTRLLMPAAAIRRSSPAAELLFDDDTSGFNTTVTVSEHAAIHSTACSCGGVPYRRDSIREAPRKGGPCSSFVELFKSWTSSFISKTKRAYYQKHFSVNLVGCTSTQYPKQHDTHVAASAKKN